MPENIDKKGIAEKFAPIICHELSKTETKRRFDCFTRIDFNEREPWNMFDRMIDFTAAFDAASLIPAVYYSVVVTATHYFILYSVYHAFDQKRRFGHEHDMEHVQVVV